MDLGTIVIIRIVTLIATSNFNTSIHVFYIANRIVGRARISSRTSRGMASSPSQLLPPPPPPLPPCVLPFPATMSADDKQTFSDLEKSSADEVKQAVQRLPSW